MDLDDQIAEIEESVRKRERSIRRRHRLDKIWRRSRPVLYGVLAVLLAGAGVLVVRHLRGSGDEPATTVGPTASAAPGSSEPFAGTPAANYPKGAAGITLPAARAVPGFSAKEVAADLAKVRTALIDSRLDPRMIVRHDPSQFLKLLSPSSQQDAKKNFGTKVAMSLVTWIDPGTPLDPGEQPRVSGRFSYAGQVEQGLPVLAVTTNFIWVYAFQRSDHPVAAQHDQIVWHFLASPRWQPSDRGMNVYGDNGYSALIDCAAATHGLLAPTPPDEGAAPDPSDTEDPNQLLNVNHGLDIHENCS